MSGAGLPAAAHPSCCTAPPLLPACEAARHSPTLRTAPLAQPPQVIPARDAPASPSAQPAPHSPRAEDNHAPPL
jgi:hypothetical protein